MKRSLVFTVLFTVGMGLAACGGSSGPSSKLDVTMTEFAFTPAEYTVPAGQQVTLNLVNNGAVEHSFIIMKKDVNIGDEFTEEDEPNVYWRTNVPAGSTAKETFTAPGEPGDYQVICGIAGHYTAGMVAKMHVVSQ